MASYLITGSARGLGLAMAEHLATFPSSEVHRVFAAARGESTALKTLIQQSAGKVQFIRMDTSKESSIQAAVNEVDAMLEEQGLDVLINNAGQSFVVSSSTTMEVLDDQLSNNVLSVHQVTRKFLPLLKKGEQKKVINVVPELGSTPRTGDYASFPVPAYKTSKAALDALTLQYSITYKEQGFTFLAMTPDVSPEWLRTEMDSKAPVEEGAKATLNRIVRAGVEESGKFLNIRVEGWEQTGLVACR